MRFDEFRKRILDYNPHANIEMIEKAFKFAKMMHSGQKRNSGEDYFSHPLGVADILIDLKAQSETICAALLHDVVEESPTTLDMIRKEFSPDIANLVEGVTKINSVNFASKDEYNAENLRKILIATAKDIRVMVIKLADRLHNMRTLKHFRPDKQKRIAKETMEIYAPIAHKLGIWKIKGELEDLSLRYLEPDIYQLLKKKIDEKREEREKNTLGITRLLKRKLAAKGIDAEVYGRAKYFYSIYKKMKKKNVDFDEIYDLIAVRIITKSVPDCYAALGVVHELWKPFPKRFKDFIATPKLNGYQSLHTSVLGSHRKILEVQIRTEEMHHLAEDGAAAHWRYKGTDRDKKFEKKLSWLKQFLEWRSTSEDASELIDTLKIDLFENEIVVFTPKGDPISLPENSTPVDFAYEVHTNIGNYCERALVNNRLVPLDSILKSGDIVEVLTSRKARPSRQWLKFVKTNKARGKIKNYLNIDYERKGGAKEHDEELPEKGIADLIETYGKKAPIKLSRCCNPKPGEEIVASLTKDKKITVHSAACPNVGTLNRDKMVSVGWKPGSHEKNTTTIRVTVRNRIGILSRVLNIVSTHKINIKSLNTRTSKENEVIRVELESIDREVINEMIKRIRSIKDVVDVNYEQ